MARLENCHDQMIEGRAPPLDAGRDVGGERAIAVVVQAHARKAIAVGRSARPDDTAVRMSYAAMRAGAIMASR